MDYSIAEVANILGTTQKAVRRNVASGELEATKRGTSYLISEEALNAFKESKTKQRDKEQPVQYDLFGTEVVTSYIKTKNGDVVNWADISGSWNEPSKSAMTFVDLFCGCGGLSKGLEMSGLEGICGLDFFKEACMTYERNFNHPFINGDITLQENKDAFYKTVKEQLNGRKLNVVAGGFPCQGFSMAGNRIVDDPRNSLYKEMLEIVKNLQPEFVICENVKGLRSMLDGAVERKIIEDYKAIGYEMNVTVL